MVVSGRQGILGCFVGILRLDPALGPLRWCLFSFPPLKPFVWKHKINGLVGPHFPTVLFFTLYKNKTKTNKRKNPTAL
jgi:hypothetical protein